MINLIHGDCLEVLKTLEPNSVDMVMTDLPYGTTKCKWDSVIDLSRMWEELNRVVKPDGAVVMTAQTPFDKVLGCSNLNNLKYEWIWEKGNATGFLNAKKMPLKAHENVLVFYRKLPTYNPQMSEGHERKVTRRIAVGSECYGKGNKVTEYDSTSRYPRSVLFFSSDKQKSSLHPTQKPVSLGEYFIKTYTNEGDVVLDICMGSGSFGVSAINTNRKFIGIEKDQDIFSVAEKRLDESLVNLKS